MPAKKAIKRKLKTTVEKVTASPAKVKKLSLPAGEFCVTCNNYSIVLSGK